MNQTERRLLIINKDLTIYAMRLITFRARPDYILKPSDYAQFRGTQLETDLLDQFDTEVTDYVVRVSHYLASFKLGFGYLYTSNWPARRPRAEIQAALREAEDLWAEYRTQVAARNYEITRRMIVEFNLVGKEDIGVITRRIKEKARTRNLQLD